MQTLARQNLHKNKLKSYANTCVYQVSRAYNPRIPGSLSTLTTGLNLLLKSQSRGPGIYRNAYNIIIKSHYSLETTAHRIIK